jgi:hypothetical protein
LEVALTHVVEVSILVNESQDRVERLSILVRKGLDSHGLEAGLESALNIKEESSSILVKHLSNEFVAAEPSGGNVHKLEQWDHEGVESKVLVFEILTNLAIIAVTNHVEANIDVTGLKVSELSQVGEKLFGVSFNSCFLIHEDLFFLGSFLSDRF